MAESEVHTAEQRPALEMMLGRLAGMTLVGAGVIHAAFIGPHLSEQLTHGIFFAVVTVVQVLSGIALCRRPNRPLLTGAALFNLGVIGVWVVSRTIGISGHVEAVGLADTVSFVLEAVAVLGGTIVVFAPRVGRRRVPPAQVGFTFGAAAVAVLLMSASAAVYGPSQHDHQGHDHGQQAAAQGPAAHPAAHDMAGMTAHDMVTPQSGSPVAATGMQHHAKLPCPNPLPQQQAAADELVKATKTGTARLANVETAKAEGYMRFGDVALGGTWHYINWKYQADSAVLDPAHPESIIYWQASPTSPLLLIGVMYIMPKVGDRGPQPGGCITQWHGHGAPFAPEGMATPEMLHTWFVPLPGGPFVTDPSHPEA